MSYWITNAESSAKGEELKKQERTDLQAEREILLCKMSYELVLRRRKERKHTPFYFLPGERCNYRCLESIQQEMSRYMLRHKVTY